MSYFDKAENVLDYIELCDGFDGRDLIEQLRRHLPNSARLLELGSGPGNDLAILKETYQVTGSDLSPHFLAHLQTRFPDLPLLTLDAIHLETNETYDGLYSNKVLHGLNDEELRLSFQHQSNRLKPGGVALHSFWLGDQIETTGEDVCYYRQPSSLEPLLPTSLTPIEEGYYSEMSDRDSFWIILGKTN